MVLYNPVTGAYKIVPRPKWPDYTDYTDYVYGFGYGATLDDLKIIRITVHDCGNSGSRYYDVFSLKSGSWSRPLELVGDYHFFKYSGTFVNGFLYWIAGKGSHWRLIVALDVKEMVFSEMLIPPGLTWNHLGTFSGRLCMVCTQADNVELWVLNELGFGKSWSKKCSSDYTSIAGHDETFKMLWILDDGKLLLLKSLSGKLIVYDMFKDSYKEVETLTSYGRLKKLQSIEYVESWTSPSDMCSAIT